jgi:DNA repair protein RecO (recombination protein O)
MLLKTRGIILRSIKYSETSLICDVLTEERGLQSYIFSGVRSAKGSGSAKAGLLQLMTLLDMVVYHKDGNHTEGGGLNRVKEIKPTHVYTQLPFDIVKRSIGLFCAEVAHKTLKQPDKNPALFQFLHDFFCYLDVTTASTINLPLFFLLELAAHLGFAPQGCADTDTPYFDMQEGFFTETLANERFTLDKSLSLQLSKLINVTIEENAALSLKTDERRTLIEKLIAYYNLHIENMPEVQSHRILREVL